MTNAAGKIILSWTGFHEKVQRTENKTYSKVFLSRNVVSVHEIATPPSLSHVWNITKRHQAASIIKPEANTRRKYKSSFEPFSRSVFTQSMKAGGHLSGDKSYFCPSWSKAFRLLLGALGVISQFSESVSMWFCKLASHKVQNNKCTYLLHHFTLKIYPMKTIYIVVWRVTCLALGVCCLTGNMYLKDVKCLLVYIAPYVYKNIL